MKTWLNSPPPDRVVMRTASANKCNLAVKASLRQGAGMALIEIEICKPWPVEHAWEAWADTIISATASVAPELAQARLTASLLFTHDDEIRRLNQEWRSKDRPTNVLSFPMLERYELLDLAPVGPPVMLGDIALAYETCAREAADNGISLEHHAAHLIVHGLLHLAGHDHVQSDAQAEAMEALEIAALAKLGIADPYGDRT